MPTENLLNSLPAHPTLAKPNVSDFGKLKKYFSPQPETPPG